MLHKMKTFLNYLRENLMIFMQIKKIHQQITHNEMVKLKNSERFSNPKNLIPYGYKIYSQNDEDGIIREIFNRIGHTNKTFIEFGVGDGLENNTLALLLEDWSGLWIEGSKKNTKKIMAGFPTAIRKKRLNVINSFITKNNINELISSAVREDEVDLLSIDIDGNDVHIFEAITCIKPRVVVIEYNAKFPPPIMFCVDHDETYVLKGDGCLGASLKYLERIFSEKNYNLVGCNLNGSNAFIVLKDLTNDKFQAPYSAETHYEPARYYLASSIYPSGHPASYRTIEKSLSIKRD
jgi:hypothetical protein